MWLLYGFQGAWGKPRDSRECIAIYRSIDRSNIVFDRRGMGDSFERVIPRPIQTFFSGNIK